MMNEKEASKHLEKAFLDGRLSPAELAQHTSRAFSDEMNDRLDEWKEYHNYIAGRSYRNPEGQEPVDLTDFE